MTMSDLVILKIIILYGLARLGEVLGHNNNNNNIFIPRKTFL